MTLKEIKEILLLVSELDLKEVKIKNDQFILKIRTEKDTGPIITSSAQAASFAPSYAPAPAMLQVADKQESAAPAPATAPQADQSGDNYIKVKSPMVGTFYRSGSPEKPSYVQVGDVVAKGSVLCIIEAMKLFNEIESEVSGKIVKVLIDDSSPVEYDQPLFLIDPQG